MFFYSFNIWKKQKKVVIFVVLKIRLLCYLFKKGNPCKMSRSFYRVFTFLSGGGKKMF